MLYSNLFNKYNNKTDKKAEEIIEYGQSKGKFKSLSTKNINENKIKLDNEILESKNFLKNSKYQNISNKKDYLFKNLKNKLYKNLTKFENLNGDDISNAKIKKIEIKISKDNINENNNDREIINFIKYIKKENREIFKNNLINNKNKTLNESIKGQTPKGFRNKKSILDFSLRNNNYLIDERTLSDRQYSLKENFKDNQIINYNKIFRKKRNYIFNKRKNNNNNISELNKNKNFRLFSSFDNKKLTTKFNKVEVNFDNMVHTENRDKEKLENDIKQIKEVLPQDEKGIFLERIKKLCFSKDKNIDRKKKK